MVLWVFVQWVLQWQGTRVLLYVNQNLQTWIIIYHFVAWFVRITVEEYYYPLLELLNINWVSLNSMVSGIRERCCWAQHFFICTTRVLMEPELFYYDKFNLSNVSVIHRYQCNFIIKGWSIANNNISKLGKYVKIIAKLPPATRLRVI